MTPAGPSLRRHVLGLAAGASLLVTLGCENNLQVHGNIPDPEEVARIQPGADNRQSVFNRLGSPSSISTFEDNTWFYIGQKTEQFAFFKPEVIERSILMVSFSNTGTVDETQIYTLEDGRVIDPVSRTTPTEGKELTLLQQLFGNVGRFSQEVGTPSAPKGPGP